ncbi:MAG: sigma factor-like helix-turn-helix DNA-binding protein [Paenibacillaceae bacterium]
MENQFGIARVAVLLHDRSRLSSRRYVGDYTASDILIDLDRAIRLAQLTERQSQVIKFVFTLDMTQEAAAIAMQVTQVAVSKTLNGACKRIANVFQNWDYNDYSKLAEGGSNIWNEQ